MFRVDGQYGSADVYADAYDNTVVDQIQSIVNHPVAHGSKIAVMPDTHSGKGSVIGWTQTVNDRICPNIVGVDIGCQIIARNIGHHDTIDFDHLDRVIRELIPNGQNVFDIGHDNAHGRELLNSLRCVKSVNVDYGCRSVGSLGGGNHFIEVDIDHNTGEYWLVVHTGSRAVGVNVCNHYMDIVNNCNRDKIKEIYGESARDLARRMKAEGRQNEIAKMLKVFKEAFFTYCVNNNGGNNDPLRYVTGSDMDDYLHDVDITQQYAQLNNQTIHDTIIREMNWDYHDEIVSIHNYVDTEHGVIRKGAVAAYNGQKVLVPINMAFGTLICTGKGNEAMNCSAPHGAGRLMSRREARKNVTIEQFEQSMHGIYSTCVSKATLDESPFVYKTYDNIAANLRLTAHIDTVIKPVYNFKAGGDC